MGCVVTQALIEATRRSAAHAQNPGHHDRRAFVASPSHDYLLPETPVENVIVMYETIKNAAFTHVRTLSVQTFNADIYHCSGGTNAALRSIDWRRQSIGRIQEVSCRGLAGNSGHDQAVHIRNYSIYYKDKHAFAYFEYVGDDFAADMAKWALIP
jgi:hypothetical protein